MEFSKFIAFFKPISVMEWLILGASALCVFVFFCNLFNKKTPKRKCLLGIIMGVLYSYIFFFVVNKEYIFDSQTGYVALIAVDILMIVTSLCCRKKFGESIGICLTQLAIYIPVALILWAIYTLADSIYKDDVYLPDPYYLFMQFVIFGTSLIYQFVLLQDITLVRKANTSEKRTSSTNDEYTPSTTSHTSTTSSSPSGSQHKYTMKDLDEAQFGPHPVDWKKEQEIRRDIFGS